VVLLIGGNLTVREEATRLGTPAEKENRAKMKRDVRDGREGGEEGTKKNFRQLSLAPVNP